MAEEGYQRDPCPWRILDDCGGAFSMGAIGGAIWHAVKGYRNAPQVRSARKKERRSRNNKMRRE